MDKRRIPTDPSSSKELFSTYYNMMVSVIHGVVLAGAAIGLSTIVVSFEKGFPISFWNLLRWILSFLFAITTAWKYLIKAHLFSWELDLLDMAIPSLLGVVLTVSFILIDNPSGWLVITICVFMFGASAGVYAIFKLDKVGADAKKRQYEANLKWNISWGPVILIAVIIVWLFGYRLINPSFVEPLICLLLLTFSLLQLYRDHSLWESIKHSEEA